MQLDTPITLSQPHTYQEQLTVPAVMSSSSHALRAALSGRCVTFSYTSMPANRETRNQGPHCCTGDGTAGADQHATASSMHLCLSRLG